jgi:hypothetical protein
MDTKWYRIGSAICIYLVTNKVEHLFIHFWPIYISSIQCLILPVCLSYCVVDLFLLSENIYICGYHSFIIIYIFLCDSILTCVLAKANLTVVCSN